VARGIDQLFVQTACGLGGAYLTHGTSGGRAAGGRTLSNQLRDGQEAAAKEK